MGNKLINWIRELFGKITGNQTRKEIALSQEHKQRYEDTHRISFTSVFANALANKACSDSTVTIEGENAEESRASAVVKPVLDYIWSNIKETVDGALGKGGMFLIPYLNGERIYVAEVDQCDVDVLEVNGADEIISMAVHKATAWKGSDRYELLMDFTLNKQELTIKHLAIDPAGEPVELSTIDDWADIEEEINISGVERMPVAYIRSPKADRKTGTYYGVPITYGCDDTIRQLNDCIDQIELEYKNKRVFVGADSMLFDGQGELPKDGIFKKFMTGGALNGGTFWEIFDPAIRDSAYLNRFAMLCSQLEKEVGTSKGILTEPTTANATATEIRAANKATFDIVSDIRKNIEKAFDDLAYSIAMYAEFAGLIPAGSAEDYSVTFDWDMSMIESTEETWNQLAELQSRGGCTLARLNSFVTGQSVEEAQVEIDEVNQENQAKAVVQEVPDNLEPDVI